MKPPRDPWKRFSGRSEDYRKHRPAYPPELVDILGEETGLEPGWVVADVGSGTGLSSAPFLDRGCAVHAVEPNREMRRAAEEWLGDRPGFESRAGRAEETGLAAASVDLVVAGQAFHWFDRAAARAEFLRITREPRWVALFWNARVTRRRGFSRAYESLLQEFGTDYEAVRRSWDVEDGVGQFFRGEVVRRSTPNVQRLDLAGLRGRTLSSSYAPAPGHPDHEPMLEALVELFHRHESGGTVTVAYETVIYVGRLRKEDA